MPIDFFASERHFVDHLVPIWKALPADERGEFTVSRGLAAHADAFGLETVEVIAPADRPMIVASSGDARTARNHHGRTEIALLEHGSGQSFGGDPRTAHQSSYPGGLNRPASLFIAPNVHAAARDAAAHPNALTAVVGCPKLDDLPERAALGSGKPVVAISFHWECTVAPETRSGWREFRNPIAGLLNHFTVIGHGHPRIIEELAVEYRRLGIEVVRDFREVVARAHVYVNEGSSTLFEAAAAGIPVVVLNPSFFRPAVDHGLRFWDAAKVGPQVSSRGTWDWRLTKDLTAAVEEALTDSPERQAAREAALDIVYAYRSGAARRAADALLEWAERPALAGGGLMLVQPAPDGILANGVLRPAVDSRLSIGQIVGPVDEVFRSTLERLGTEGWPEPDQPSPGGQGGHEIAGINSLVGHAGHRTSGRVA